MKEVPVEVIKIDERRMMEVMERENQVRIREDKLKGLIDKSKLLDFLILNKMNWSRSYRGNELLDQVISQIRNNF